MKRLTIFCHHDKDNIIDDYVVYWIKYMSKLSDIIFVSNNNLENTELEKINDLVIKSIAFSNNGIGVKSILIGYEWAYNNNILSNYDWLFIILDSIFGPFFDIEPFILKQEQKKKIAYGFTKALVNKKNEHIQSTFTAIPNAIFTSKEFALFFESIKDIKGKKNVEVFKYEFAISKLIRDMGYKLEGFFDDIDPTYKKYEPMKPSFIEMVKKGYPFIRRTIFTKNYYFIENLNDYLELKNIIPKECFDNMVKHMSRIINKDELNISINYPWIREYLIEKEKIISNYYKNNLNYDIEFFEKKTFIEKINWIKIYYNDQLMLQCCDKYLVREYIEKNIGNKYLIPVLDIYNNHAEVLYNFDVNDYNENFVMASTINDNFYLVDDYKKHEHEKIYKIATDLIDFKNNQYLKDLQWCYKYVKPRLLIYKYIKEIHESNKIYKVLCFNSEPKIIKVIIKNDSEIFANFYDLNWNLLDLKQNYDIYNVDIEKPVHFQEMLEVSKKLSLNFRYFVAIDFIDTDAQLYFKEYDFYSNDITYPLSNELYDIEWGNMIKNLNILNEYFVIDKDTISRTLAFFEKDLFNIKNILNKSLDITNSLNSKLNNCNNRINYINNKNEELKLNLNWFNILSIFGIELFSISNNSNYLRLTILGIKLTFRVNENSINKIAWWIPVKKWRDSFRNKFRL